MAFPYSVDTGSDQELLDYTRAAIAKITMTGQAYTQDGLSLTRADLASLRTQAEWLEGRINKAAAVASGVSAENLVRLKRPA